MIDSLGSSIVFRRLFSLMSAAFWVDKNMMSNHMSAQAQSSNLSKLLIILKDFIDGDACSRGDGCNYSEHFPKTRIEFVEPRIGAVFKACETLVYCVNGFCLRALLFFNFSQFEQNFSANAILLGEFYVEVFAVAFATFFKFFFAHFSGGWI